MNMQNVKPILSWIAARAKEPSTWAALSPVFGALGWAIDEKQGAAIGLGISTVLGIILKEKAS